MKRAWSLLGLATLLVVLSALPAAEAADFYQGKTIRIISAGAPGGNYHLHARLLGDFMGKHLPGNPTVVVQTMPGGGGVIAANHVFSVAARDGTELGQFTRDSILLPFIGNEAAKFSSTEFNWIGTPASYEGDAFVVFIRSALPHKSIEDLRRAPQPISLGNHGNVFVPLVKEAMGANVNIIKGYRGGSVIRLALTQGEIDGMGNGYGNFPRQFPDWLANNFVRFLVQYGHDKRIDALPDVPTAREMARTPEDLALIKFFELSLTLGFPLAAPPGVPEERLAQLRAAFDATMRDPAYIATLAKAKLDFSPKSGARLAADIRDGTNVSPAMADRYKRLAGEAGGGE